MILAMICATISRRSGESFSVRARKFGRPSEFSAALVIFLLLLSGGIADLPGNAERWSSRRVRSDAFR